MFKEKPEFLDRCSKITVEQIRLLLGERDWRPKSIASFYSAIINLKEVENDIGKLLLKNEFGRVGYPYILCLTSFSNSKSIDYINQYLDYYLTLPGHNYFQPVAMSALAYIDKTTGSDYFKKKLYAWERFAKGCVNFRLKEQVKLFEEQMLFFQELRDQNSKDVTRISTTSTEFDQ